MSRMSDVAGSSAGASDADNEQKLKDVLKDERNKYRRYKFVLQTIEECLEDDPDLNKRVKSIILNESASQIRLGDVHSQTVLGVELGSSALSYNDSNRLQTLLNFKLEEKCKRAKREHLRRFGKHDNLNRKIDNAVLFEYKNKLLEEQRICKDRQCELLALLEGLADIRLTVVPEMTDKKVEEFQLRSRINWLKSQLVRDKCRIDVFMESRDSLNSYKEIMKDLKNQIDECKVEIEHLKALKVKYEQVSSKEYDELLKSYLQYKDLLEQRKRRVLTS